MAGPWEQYAPADDQAGPWAAYQAPARTERRQAGASGTWLPDEAAERAGRAQRLVQGLRDPLDAAAQLAAHALPSGVVDAVNRGTAALNEVPVLGTIMKTLGMTPASTQEIDQRIAENEREYQDARRATGSTGIDFARAGGNVLSTLPLALIGPAAGAASLPARMAAGAASGAGAGALQPVTENAQNFAAEKGKQIATGAAFGAAAAPVTGAVARVVRPNTRAEVQTLIDEGVTPTPGKILGGAFARAEDKARSIPIVGDAITAAQRSGIEDFNRAAYARALAPIGGRVPRDVGHAAVDDVHRQLSTAYNHLLPNLQFRADQQFAAELTRVHGMAAQLPAAQAQRFEQILREQVLGKLTPQGNASGATIKEVESQLGRLARGYRSSQDFDVRQLGDAIREVQANIRHTLERTNPTHARALQNINQGWSELVRIENAAARQGSAGGVFTPAQLDAAVRATDTSVRKNAKARGQAQMQDLSAAGVDVLGSKYPDSGTAGRLLFSAGAGGGAAMLEPTVLTGAAAASLPYLPIMRQAFAALLAQRPQAATAIADRIRQIVGPAASIGAPAVYEGARQ